MKLDRTLKNYILTVVVLSLLEEKLKKPSLKNDLFITKTGGMEDKNEYSLSFRGIYIKSL